MNLSRFLHLRMQGASMDAPVFNDTSRSGSTTTVQQSDPWSGVQPHLIRMFDTATGQFGQGPQVPPLSSETQSAQNMQSNRAVAGSPVTDAAKQSLTATLQGNYLDPTQNPAWQPTVERMADAYRLGTAAPTDARFAKSGNAFSDNSAYQELRGLNERGFGDALAGFAGKIYGDERDRMLKGGLIAPSLANQDYADISQLGQVGAMKDLRSQQELDAPWDLLTKYQRILSGQPGGEGSMQSPYFTNPAANALGLGMMGLSIYDMLGS